MAKASYHTAKDAFRWRFLASLIQDLPLEQLITQAIKTVSLQRWSGSGRWLLITTGVVAMLYWNGRLVVATGAGVGVMLLVHLMHNQKPERHLAEIRKFLSGWNQPFVLSVGAGAVVTLTTYLAAAVWAESDSHWIASGAILQGLGTLAVLVLLVGQILNRQASRDRVHFNQMIADLAHDDPLKRLIAVRQLTDSVSFLQDDRAPRQTSGRKPSRRDVADYFRLMLSHEPEPIIREAVLDGLQTLDIVHQLKQATQPVVDVPARKLPFAKTRRVASARSLHQSLYEDSP